MACPSSSNFEVKTEDKKFLLCQKDVTCVIPHEFPGQTVLKLKPNAAKLFSIYTRIHKGKKLFMKVCNKAVGSPEIKDEISSGLVSVELDTNEVNCLKKAVKSCD